MEWFPSPSVLTVYLTEVIKTNSATLSLDSERVFYRTNRIFFGNTLQKHGFGKSFIK